MVESSEEPKKVVALREADRPTSATNSSEIQLHLKQSLGVTTEVNPGMLQLDDGHIIYVSGHNIVIQNVDHMTQRYIQGQEGCEGITALAISHNSKYLAVCEKSTQAVCFIYDVIQGKRKKVLTSVDCAADSFTGVNFARSSDK